MGPALTGLLIRLWMGVAGVMAAGLLIFRGRLFLFGDPAFQCLTAGILTAAILTLVRSDRPLQATALAAAFGLFRLGLIERIGWVAAVSGLVLATGILIGAWIFDLLARRGLRFGKFLVLGPLLGGVFFAVAPMAEFHTMNSIIAMRTLLEYFFIGIVVGDGAGLGVEVADLVHSGLERAREGLIEE